MRGILCLRYFDARAPLGCCFDSTLSLLSRFLSLFLSHYGSLSSESPHHPIVRSNSIINIIIIITIITIIIAPTHVVFILSNMHHHPTFHNT